MNFIIAYLFTEHFADLGIFHRTYSAAGLFHLAEIAVAENINIAVNILIA
jgi:hypothetical protein